jgi:hypothetical protein
MVDVIGLTQKLISFNTINPPGNELVVAKIVRWSSDFYFRSGTTRNGRPNR